MLSFGIFKDLAEPTADLNLIFFSGSGPPSLTATEISLPSLEKIFALFFPEHLFGA